MRKPLILFSFLIFYFSQSHAQTWNSLGKGVNRDVDALLAYDSVLFVGGRFDSAGGKRVNYIAEWDGNNWYSLASGMNIGGGVNALAMYNGELYAAGGFDSAGGVLAKNIAAWDGHNWSPLGTGTNGYINALTVYNGDLYAVGAFTIAGGVSAFGVAKWDGTIWTGIDSEISGSYPGTVTVYKGNLYIGGAMDSISHIHVNRIAKWDGVQWDSLSNNKWNCTFDCLYGDDSVLYGGGNGGSIKSRVDLFGQWNDSSWDSVPNTLENINGAGVFSINSFQGLVYVGGDFDSIGGIYSPSISMWDGNKWASLGTGVHHKSLGVLAISEFDSEIYVGGEFDKAGGNPIFDIAKWGKGVPLGYEMSALRNIIQVYPNPSNGVFQLIISNRQLGINAKIEVYSELGQKVYSQLSILNSQFSIDLSKQPSGIYLYRVITEDGDVIGTGKLIIN